MSRKQIDCALNRYYQLKAVKYYNRYSRTYNDTMNECIGIFSEWCEHNGYDSDTISIEIQKQAEQCKLIQFDPYFPAIKDIEYRVETDKKQIFQVIKKCWNDQNAFVLDLIFHEKKDPNKYIFDNIKQKQRLWFDGYFRQNHNVYIPLEIINLIRLFFEIDMKSLYIPYKVQSKRSHNKFKYTQKLCNVANKLKKGEYFIAYNIISSLISAKIHNDDIANAALYFYRAIILRRWKSLNDAEKDIKLSIQFHSTGISGNEYGKILFAKRKYHQALEQFIDAITLSEKDNNITTQIKCHTSCCKVYEEMGYLHNARMHYLRIIALQPLEASHQYNYAKYMQKKIKHYDKAGIYYEKAIELNPTECKYRYEYGRMLINHANKYNLALQQLLYVNKIKPDDSKCAYQLTKCYDALKDYDNAKVYTLKCIKSS